MELWLCIAAVVVVYVAAELRDQYYFEDLKERIAIGEKLNNRDLKSYFFLVKRYHGQPKIYSSLEYKKQVEFLDIIFAEKDKTFLEIFYINFENLSIISPHCDDILLYTILTYVMFDLHGRLHLKYFNYRFEIGEKLSSESLFTYFRLIKKYHGQKSYTNFFEEDKNQELVVTSSEKNEISNSFLEFFCTDFQNLLTILFDYTRVSISILLIFFVFILNILSIKRNLYKFIKKYIEKK